MVSLEEINGEIEKLVEMPTSYSTIQKLAWLYTVRDHLSPVSAMEADGIPQGESEFLTACAGRRVSEVICITDELMETLSIIQPRLYHAVMNRLV